MYIYAFQAEALITLAGALERAGQYTYALSIWEKSEQVIASIGSAYSGWQTLPLCHLVKGLAQAHLWQKAEQVLASINDPGWRIPTSRSLARAYAQAHLWQEAEKITTSLPRVPYRMIALRCLARDYAKAHRWADAQRIVMAISDPVQRAIAFAQTAMVCRQAGQTEQAQKLYEATTSIIISLGSCAPEEEWSQEAALRNLVTVLLQGQQWQEARRVAELLTSSYSRAEAFHAIVTSMAKAHQWQEAEHMMEGTHQPPLQQALVLSEIALACMQVRAILPAQCLWQKAEQIARTLTSPYDQGLAFHRLAITLTRVQQWRQARQVAALIPDASLQAQATHDIVITLTKAGLGKKARQVATCIKDRSRQAQALQHIASSQDQAKELPANSGIRTQKNGLSNDNPRWKSWILAQEARDLAKAHQWQMAEQVIASIFDLAIQAKALQDLARDLTRAELWQEAERVIHRMPQAESHL
ncbi:MAG TPA: hypothetical protein VFN35_33330 [Ktedonobacteraceae bacterium]|nr:hypothetical protein [Ktedonobacteraceae bacterium]